MLLEPTYRVEIIKDTEYDLKMSEVEDVLTLHVNNGYYNSWDNKKMFYEFFKTKNARASIVIIHGYTEFSKKYHELSWYFIQMGYNVFLYDLRSHGYSHRFHSDKQLTHVDQFDDYVNDLECFINQIVTPNSSDAPVYLYSHSMGGAIASLYLLECNNNVAKTILSSPMIHPVCPPIPRQILRKLIKNDAKKKGWDTKFKYSSEFNPDAKVTNSNDISKSRFQYNLNLRINDLNYRNSYASNKWNYEVLGVMDRILNNANTGNIKSEVLIISAGKDTAVKQRPQKKLAKLLSCKYKCFRNSRHSIYTLPDVELAEYIDTLIEFYSED